MILRVRAAVAAALVAILTGAPSAQTPATAAQTPAAYTVLSREGRRPLATRTFNGQEMFAVDDLARLFGLGLREETIGGGLTITIQNQSILLSPGQELVSVAGRLVSLPAPPVKEGRAWFVPVDFIARALAPVANARVELRKPSRLIVHGDIRAPRVAGRIESQGPALARLTLDVAPATPHTVNHEGSRLVIRLEADALDASLPATTSPELIQNVRVEAPSTVVIDLGPRFASFKTSDLPGDRGAVRIQLDVSAQTTESSGAPAPGVPAEAPPLLDVSPIGGLRSVVIDAGHGGADEGARSADGTAEKTVTMAVARRLKAALEARLGLRVILTRDGDDAVPLDRRAAVANNNKADLFISLHANASVRPAAAGAEVFYLSLDEYGDEALRASTTPRETLPLFSGGSRDIEVVRWQLAQARHIGESAALARTVESSLRARVTMSARSLQQAPFRVLVGANMPAVLVEIGFMTNAQQARQLASDQYQGEIVQALVDAIVQFREGRGAAVPPGGAGR
jgi:N-acetylmuramoyl-L-alanine amidase